jgi:hypothetical protein
MVAKNLKKCRDYPNSKTVERPLFEIKTLNFSDLQRLAQE